MEEGAREYANQTTLDATNYMWNLQVYIGTHIDMCNRPPELQMCKIDQNALFFE